MNGTDECIGDDAKMERELETGIPYAATLFPILAHAFSSNDRNPAGNSVTRRGPPRPADSDKIGPEPTESR